MNKIRELAERLGMKPADVARRELAHILNGGIPVGVQVKLAQLRAEYGSLNEHHASLSTLRTQLHDEDRAHIDQELARLATRMTRIAEDVTTIQSYWTSPHAHVTPPPTIAAAALAPLAFAGLGLVAGLLVAAGIIWLILNRRASNGLMRLTNASKARDAAEHPNPSVGRQTCESCRFLEHPEEPPTYTVQTFEEAYLHNPSAMAIRIAQFLTQTGGLAKGQRLSREYHFNAVDEEGRAIPEPVHILFLTETEYKERTSNAGRRAQPREAVQSRPASPPPTPPQDAPPTPLPLPDPITPAMGHTNGNGRRSEA